MTTDLLIGAAAFVVAGLTLFSGFGLGTLLMPVFALVFPIEVAVAATAVVHAANNLFKLGLLFGDVDRAVLLRFGVPAVVTAFLGAALLTGLAGRDPIVTWSLAGRTCTITPLKLTMGLLILVFAAFDLVPALRAIRLPLRFLPIGGALSGFFGGLSGHQGALRAAFLGRLDLTPTAFAATMAALACVVDAARILVYGAALWTGRLEGLSSSSQWRPVLIATLAALAGSLLARRLLHKVTILFVHVLTGVLLVVIGVGLASGVL